MISCKRKNLSLEKQLYFLGWILVAVLLIPGIIYLRMAEAGTATKCVIYSLFHVYCPGCGGTRAVWSLFEGYFLRSLWYHPLVLYGTVVFGGYMVSHTLNLLTGGKIPGMKFRPAYLWIALVLVFGNLIVKNVLLLKFGITLDSIL